MALIFFNIHHAVQTHDKVLQISGGTEGAYDLGRLESILVHIQNDDYYPTFESKLTHLVYAVNKAIALLMVIRGHPLHLELSFWK